MQTIPYRYILIRYCTLSYKKRFCVKKVLDVQKMSYLSKQVKSYGGMVTKCFIVNLFINSGTIPYRYILIRYCTLTYKKRFCDKLSPTCEKISYLSKLPLTFNFHMFYMGGNKMSYCKFVFYNPDNPLQIFPLYLTRYCRSHKKRFCVLAEKNHKT